jgi:zinc D-Ala-D-Ala dipeptidase
MPLLHSFIYKITKALINMICGLLLLIVMAAPARGQKLSQNRYGLRVISRLQELKEMVMANADNEMLDIKKYIPGVATDLKYCGTDNFMQQKLYPDTHTSYMRKPAVLALAAVQKKLAQKGLGLKIWDAYRPYSVTVKMWEPVKDDRYAADPKFGSGHNRGAAVDLTLINLTTQQELDMGTGFDHFSDTAHADFKDLPAGVLENRMLLRTVMEENGFKVLDTEWWHFYLPDAKKYELLDVSFKQLKRLNKTGQSK